MSTRPLKLDPIMLAAHVAQTVRVAQRFAYAQLSPDLRVLQASPKFLDLIDPPVEQPLGILVEELLDEMFGAAEMLIAVLNSEIPFYRLEYINRVQPSGSIVYLAFHVTAMDEEKPHRGLLLLVEDVTESGNLRQRLVQDRNELQLLQDRIAKANHELTQLNRLKSLFLSMAAHDLRSPLAVTRLQVDLLSMQMPPHLLKTYEKSLDMIRAQVEKLDRLINDLLDLDRLEQGQMKLKIAPCIVNDILQEVIKSMEILFQRSERHVTVDLPPALTLQADPTRLWQILYNLLSNAIKYSKTGGQINVVGYRLNDEVSLHVRDDGKGMTANEVAQLFQPYYRTQEATTSEVAGTGLGLYIVKMLVEAHNGRIEVDSHVGHGTTFSVYFPTG